MPYLPSSSLVPLSGEKPKAQNVRAIIIIEEEPSLSTQVKRTTPAHLIGKGKTLGDIVSPIVDQENWECLIR
ncbi:hypothetical protein B1L04_01305 [Microcystis aeruginosa KW]|uniref:Uncharacterized protein n=1 Tax=Microcystis aeruginosa KW TaxID=1960155 RepID=A0A1V4BZ63_MICAE|nr:hypothetical protein B1L04_01305 [Microcystis aeruginosa KW]